MSKQVQILPFYTKFGFTLAEVLITLAIIGIVAVLTVPNLLQSYKKQVVASKLQKIYSLMNQAILMSEIKNGHKETWANCYEKAEDSLNNTANCKSYYENYILPYIQYLKIKEFQAAGGYNIAIYLNDGTVLVGKNTSDGVDYYFRRNIATFPCMVVDGIVHEPIYDNCRHYGGNCCNDCNGCCVFALFHFYFNISLLLFRHGGFRCWHGRAPSPCMYIYPCR